MQSLNFPDITVRTQLTNGVMRIFDSIRKKWIVLTPEEWVRQHLIGYLRDHLGYPSTLMGVEKSLSYQGMQKRSDLVVYGRDARPLLLAECKAPEIAIDGKTFDQAARYNQHYQVPYLLVTNGLIHYCCKMDLTNGTWIFAETLPRYEALGQ